MIKVELTCTHEFLSNYVSGYTLLEFDGSFGADIIKLPPLGFPVIHFQYGEKTNFYHYDSLKHEALIIGQLTVHHLVRPFKGTKLIGIDFKPYGPYNLFMFHMNQIANTAVPANTFFGETAINKVIFALQGSQTPAEKVEIVENFLIESANGRQARNLSVYDALVDRAVQKNGMLKVEDMLCETVKQRNLQRYFKQRIGIPPKLFLQILRHKFVLQAMFANPQFTWRDPVLDGFYYDQSHFDRDFVRFSDQKPREYLQIDHILARKLV